MVKRILGQVNRFPANTWSWSYLMEKSRKKKSLNNGAAYRHTDLLFRNHITNAKYKIETVH